MRKNKKLVTYLASMLTLTGAMPNMPNMPNMSNSVTFAAERTEAELKCDGVIRMFVEWLKHMKKDFEQSYHTPDWSDRREYEKKLNDSFDTDSDNFHRTYVSPFLASYYATNENDRKYGEDFKSIINTLGNDGIFCGTQLLGMQLDGGVKFIGDIVGSYIESTKTSYQLRTVKEYITKTLGPSKTGEYITKGVMAMAGMGACLILAQVLGAIIKSVNDTMVQQREMSRKAKFQRNVDFWAKKYAKSICRDPNKINVSKLIERLNKIKGSYPYAKKEVGLFINAYLGALLDKQIDPRAKCSPIVLIGAPGCGKSRLIKEVVNATRLSYEGEGWESDDKPEKKSLFEKLFGKKKIETSSDPLKTGWERDCVYICQDKIDKKSSVSPKDQLFGKHEEQRQDVKVTVYSEDYIANNFGGENIYLKFVDEFDKLDPAVLENCWDSADGGGKAVIIAAANGLPTDYVDIKGASGKAAFLSRTISIFLPSPDAAYYGKYIRRGINKLNKECENVKIKLDKATLEILKNQCVSEQAGMRSVIKMLEVIKGLQGMCENYNIPTATLIPGKLTQDVTCKELNDYQKQADLEDSIDAEETASEPADLGNPTA